MSGKRSIEKHRKSRTEKRLRGGTEKVARVPHHYFNDHYYTGSYTRTVISERLAGALVLE
jgi:hypothetical protein